MLRYTCSTLPSTIQAPTAVIYIARSSTTTTSTAPQSINWSISQWWLKVRNHLMKHEEDFRVNRTEQSRILIKSGKYEKKKWFQVLIKMEPTHFNTFINELKYFYQLLLNTSVTYSDILYSYTCLRGHPVDWSI